MTTASRDPYEVLGVARDAEWEAIQGAYRALCRKWHPDVNPQGEARMKELNEAFAVLSDPAKRAELDRSGPVGSSGRNPGPPQRNSPPPRGPQPPPTSRPPRCPPSGNATRRASDDWSRRLSDPLVHRLLLFLSIFVASSLAALLLGRQHVQAALLAGEMCAGLPAGHRAVQRFLATPAGGMATSVAALSARDRVLRWLLLIVLRCAVTVAAGLVAGPAEILMAAFSQHQAKGGSA